MNCALSEFLHALLIETAWTEWPNAQFTIYVIVHPESLKINARSQSELSFYIIQIEYTLSKARVHLGPLKCAKTAESLRNVMRINR
jgi:hypothetical protein